VVSALKEQQQTILSVLFYQQFARKQSLLLEQARLLTSCSCQQQLDAATHATMNTPAATDSQRNPEEIN